jgi:hypothetical protein
MVGKTCLAVEETKETIYIAVFFGAPPGELRLVRNAAIVIENSMVGPPVNKSLEAFNNGFIELRCHLAPFGNEFSIVFNVFFDPSIGNETASRYCDEISNEFLKVFGYQELEVFKKEHGFEESKIRVYRAFGHGQYNKEEVSKFLKYAPTNGFSKLIGGLVDKYVPGDSVTWLDPYYTLKKVGSDFYWDLAVYASTSELLPWDIKNYPKSISINELLNNNSPLIDEPLPNQKIVILIENRTLELSSGLTNYTIGIQKIQPQGYTIGSGDENWSNAIEIKYNHLFPMNDVVIDVVINSSTQPHPLRIEILAGIIGTVICSLALVAVIVYAKKKQREAGKNVR